MNKEIFLENVLKSLPFDISSGVHQAYVTFIFHDQIMLPFISNKVKFKYKEFIITDSSYHSTRKTIDYLYKYNLSFHIHIYETNEYHGIYFKKSGIEYKNSYYNDLSKYELDNYKLYEVMNII